MRSERCEVWSLLQILGSTFTPLRVVTLVTTTITVGQGSGSTTYMWLPNSRSWIILMPLCFEWIRHSLPVRLAIPALCRQQGYCPATQKAKCNVKTFFDCFTEGDSLEIRAGNTSNAPLLWNLTFGFVGEEFVSNSGIYIRLKLNCSSSKQFNAVFSSFSNATLWGGSESYIFEY